MMNEKELKILLAAGESDRLEFKENFDKEAVETAGAFASTKGGIILIGVSRTGRVQGTQARKETLKDWVNQISQSTEPRVIPEIELHEVDKKRIVAILIKQFPVKPVSVKGRCYRRVGNSNLTMPPREVAEMHLHSTGTSWDKLPARDASLADIDLKKVKRYIRGANSTGRRNIGAAEGPLKVLEKLELVKDGKPTWAAVLLFRKEPGRFLSQAAMHCGRFKEQTIVIDDRMIEGALTDQIDQAMDFIRKNINVRFVMTGKPARDEVWDYPLDALREAITNAICHRDYTILSNTDVRIHDDKLIVWNPGGLPFGITLEELYKPHPSILRNKGVGAVFYDMGWIEQWGSGIDKMRTACLKAGIPEPKFEEHQGFRVTFRKDVYTEEYLRGLGLNERQIKAVMYVKEKGKITNREYRGLSDITDRMALIDLSELCAKGILERIGRTGRRTQYVFSKTRNKPEINPKTDSGRA